MYRNVIIGTVAAAAVLGAGGTALAVTGSDSTSGSLSSATGASTASALTSDSAANGSSTPSAAGHSKKRGKGGLLRRLQHGTVVTKGKGGEVTHDLIRGTVSTVSATSIKVKATDGTSMTFAVTKDTKVRVRDNGKGAASTISKVATGDRVLVAGTGTSTLTAKHVLDVKGAK